MTKSTITRERIQRIIRAIDSESYDEEEIREWLTSDEIMELARMALAAMGSEPHTDDELSNLLWYSQEATCHSDPNYYCEFQRLATPGLIAGIIRELQERRKADSEPVENHIGSKNSLDAIVSFIKSKSNPTVKCYEEVSEQLFKDNCHGIHSHVIEYILKLGEELEDFRAEQAEMPPAQPVADSEPDRNPVLAYADSYRDMAKQGVESVPIWSVITDLERNIAPLYRHAQPAPGYPEVLPCSVLLEPGLRFGKGIKTSTMLAALARRAVYESDMAALSPEERAEFQARIEDFKALIVQPAPAVPEEITIETATIIAYGLPTTNIGAIFKAGHDACRAARLKAQPQNAPQNIPEIIPDCWCRACRPVVLNDMRFVVCPDCGNKRCPRANDHRNACTGSNEPGQEGSAYPDTQREVKP